MMRSIVDSPAVQGRTMYPVGCPPPSKGNKESTTQITPVDKTTRQKSTNNNNTTTNNSTSTTNLTTSRGEYKNNVTNNANKRQRPHPKVFDYDILAVLGRGGYGKVLLVREKKATQMASPADKKLIPLYAMKVIRKAILTKKKQIERTKLERDIMARCNHPFVVNLKSSFQTIENVYLVIEFAQGMFIYKFFFLDFLFFLTCC